MSLPFRGLIGVSREDLASASQDVHWVQAASAADVHIPDPVFLGGAAERSVLDRHFGSRPLTTREAGCLVCRHAYAYDYGLVIKDRHILLDQLLTVENSQLGSWGFFSNVRNLGDDGYHLVSAIERPEKLGRAVLILKRSDFVHGHWLLEALPKVRLAMSLMDEQAPTSYIVSTNVSASQVEMLEALGVPKSSIVRLAPNETIFCEELWIPSLAHTNELWIHPTANVTFDALVEYVRAPGDRNTPRDLFVTRSTRRNDPRPLLNANDIEAVAHSYGFAIVDPGAIPWQEQVKIFSGAERIVGLCGSGLHNTLFTGSDAHVCALQQNQNNNYMQTSIAGLRGHQVSYILGESFSAFDPLTWDCGFLIDPDLLDLFLRRYA